MTYKIADGSARDIQIGDFINTSADILSLKPSAEFEVLGFDPAGVNLLISINDSQTWLSSSLVTSVWRSI